MSGTRPPDTIITQPAERREAVLDVIRQARHRIGLSLFRANDKEIFAELTRAVARGLDVDVLVTSRAKGGKKKRKKLWLALESTGAAIYPYTDAVVKYHAKYLVADDGPALVSSLNFTRKCFNKTCDAILVTYDPVVVSSLNRLMDADRQGTPISDDLSERIVIGPERARRQLTELLEQARTSIKLIDAKLSDPGLVALLNARRAAGVAVEIYGAKRYADLVSHGKMMLIDGQRAVVGSLALAALSLDFRREVAIVVDEPSAVAAIEDLFRFVATAAAKDSDVEANAEGGAEC
jgi:phosphatidylserine/phosphatidylglycerophosphate/cardiolipin synthase-like enzyme